VKSVDFLIVGGSAAGTTAAEVIRGLTPKASITIVTDENHTQYSRVILKNYIRGELAREKVFLKKDQWYKEKNIQLIKGVRVESLDSSKKRVSLGNGDEIGFGKLLLTVGGNAKKLSVWGIDLENILYLRTIDDADAIVKVTKNSRSAVIVGGGFIGLDMICSFKKSGIKDVTVLIKDPYFWFGKLDEMSSKVLSAELIRNGIKVVTGEEVLKFEGKNSSNKVGAVITKSGKKYSADVVAVGVGIKSDLSFLEGSGININQGIVTNQYLETNVPNIYSAGDCAEFEDVIFSRKHLVGNWANATSQGSAVGKTMAGEKTVFETASSYSINFFDGSCTFIGVTEDDYSDDVINRGSVNENKMTRIFIKKIDGKTRIIGATIINSIVDVASLTSAVKGKTDVLSRIEKLKDSKLELRETLQ